MTAKIVNVVLNQQQLELLDNTIARGIAPDRATLIRLALKEFAARHSATKTPKSRKKSTTGRRK